MTKRRIWLLLPVTTPYGSRAEGFWIDAGVLVPHRSSVQPARARPGGIRNSCIGWHGLQRRSCFYPRPYAVEPAETRLGLKRAKRTTELFSHRVQKTEIVFRRRPARLLSLALKGRALRRDFGKFSDSMRPIEICSIFWLRFQPECCATSTS
jgi:hypothetical protein